MTTYLALSSGDHIALSDGSDVILLPDNANVDDALYAQWLKEGQPAYFLYNQVAYLRIITPINVNFIRIARGEYPERADGNKKWDGLYGPYGRQWWLSNAPVPASTTLSLSDGSIMTLDNGHTVEMKG